MEAQKRATVYFTPEIHRALRLKAAASESSISEMVNDAVKASLADEAADLAAFEKRRTEGGFVRIVRSGLKRRGRI